MRNLKVELLRFGRNSGVLLDRYLVAIDGFPAREVTPEVEAEDILLALDRLRYRRPPGGATEDSARQAQVSMEQGVELLRSLVEKFLVDLPQLAPSREVTQIDIVTDKVELWALPFELARKDGRDLLGDPERPVLLTRRVRRSFAERAHPWPVKPRVLFAWFGDVQHEEHRDAFYAALEPWIGPMDFGMIRDASPVLTLLRDASLQELADECRKAATGNPAQPYTHIHILAHGVELPAQVRGLESFGVALKDGAARAEDVASALRAGEPGGPSVVTLAVCDSANAANSIISGGRVAYQLHTRGVPVVVGSQFPLTERGAIVFTKHFYKRLLADAADLRVALCEARAALRSSGIPGHDWASITAHMTLPEGYLDQLGERAQRVALEQLNTVSRWAQRITERTDAAAKGVSAADVARIEGLLADRIAVLEKRIQGDVVHTQAARLEDLGLLGSAHKRHAELVFNAQQEGANERSRTILAKAGEWYLRAHDQALSHHWTGTQHLAITAVTTGSIPEERAVHWLSARHGAGLDAAQGAKDDPALRESTIWALGSLVELALLRPCLPPSLSASPIPEARESLAQLVDLANSDPPMAWTINSTWRQLRRYVTWWTSENGFFPDREDLSVPAKALADALEPHTRR